MKNLENVPFILTFHLFPLFILKALYVSFTVFAKLLLVAYILSFPLASDCICEQKLCFIGPAITVFSIKQHIYNVEWMTSHPPALRFTHHLFGYWVTRVTNDQLWSVIICMMTFPLNDWKWHILKHWINIKKWNDRISQKLSLSMLESLIKRYLVKKSRCQNQKAYHYKNIWK